MLRPDGRLVLVAGGVTVDAGGGFRSEIPSRLARNASQVMLLALPRGVEPPKEIEARANDRLPAGWEILDHAPPGRTDGE